MTNKYTHYVCYYMYTPGNKHNKIVKIYTLRIHIKTKKKTKWLINVFIISI